MSSVPDKPKVERVKETVRLLKGLKANGLGDASAGYREIKDIMTKWVEDGEAAEARIDLFRQNRIAHVSLPKESDKPATISLKVVQENDLD